MHVKDELIERVNLMSDEEQISLLEYLNTYHDVEDVQYNNEIDESLIEYEKNGGISHDEVMKKALECIQ